MFRTGFRACPGHTTDVPLTNRFVAPRSCLREGANPRRFAHFRVSLASDGDIRMRRRVSFIVWIFFILAPGFAGCGGSTPTEPGAQDKPNAERDSSVASPSIVEPNRYLVFLENSSARAVTLKLDKQKALSLFGTTWSRQIRLLEVQSSALLENVLETIRDACGTAWRNDSPDPGYDCQKTQLGRSFGPDWRESAEFALVRLLGMTPANANLKGSSLEDFAALVNQNSSTFRFDFADVLAESLGIARTEPFVPIMPLVRSLQQNLLGTHPAVANVEGRLPVSLYDALLDLGPLAERFGPIGEHPGVLLPDGPGFVTKSNVLGPDFLMRVEARSNLRRAQGVSFSRGAGDMFISLADAPLSFDFEDPRSLVVEGIQENPTIDMRLSITEAPTAIARCEGDPKCRPFFLEHIVNVAAKNAYGSRVYRRCHVSLDADCLVGVDIGKQGAAPGLAVFMNELRGVSVPPPQLLWDLLTEVAQVALHDPTRDGLPDIAEGQAQPIFALRGVPIGLRGSQLVDQMRPILQSQADLMAKIIAGRYWAHNDDLDVFVFPGLPSQNPYLFFVAPSDIRPDPANPDQPKPYAYLRPGFFSKPDLSESSRVSAKVIANVDDTEHEKISLAVGERLLYAQDDEENIYELTIFVPKDGGREAPIEIALQHLGRSK